MRYRGTQIIPFSEIQQPSGTTVFIKIEPHSFLLNYNRTKQLIIAGSAPAMSKASETESDNKDVLSCMVPLDCY
jgi:hypothetical protein